jgi:hypothetical protein
VTPKLIKVTYGIVMAVAAVAALLPVVAAFRTSAGFGLLTLLVLAPLFFLFYVIVYRVILEVVMAVFRIAENTSVMAAAVNPAAGGSQRTPAGCRRTAARWGGPGRMGAGPGRTARSASRGSCRARGASRTASGSARSASRTVDDRRGRFPARPAGLSG